MEYCTCEFKPYGVIEVDDISRPIHDSCGKEIDLKNLPSGYLDTFTEGIDRNNELIPGLWGAKELERAAEGIRR